MEIILTNFSWKTNPNSPQKWRPQNIPIRPPNGAFKKNQLSKHTNSTAKWSLSKKMEPSKHSDRPQNGSFKTLKHSNSPQKWSLPKKTEPSKQSNCPKINGAFPKKLSLQNNLIAPKMEPSKKKTELQNNLVRPRNGALNTHHYVSFLLFTTSQLLLGGHTANRPMRRSMDYETISAGWFNRFGCLELWNFQRSGTYAYRIKSLRIEILNFWVLYNQAWKCSLG